MSLSPMVWLAAGRDHTLQQDQPSSLAKRRKSSSAAATTASLRPASGKSPLLSLPPELRNQIYISLFASEAQRIRSDYRIPGLLLACKQTCEEALGLYYLHSSFRCLDENSTVQWLTNLPSLYLDLVEEVKYDTRWIIFCTPYIPVPGAECWLYQKLVKRLANAGFDVDKLGVFAKDGELMQGTGKLKVSFYRRGGRESGIQWTDNPGLIEAVTGS